MKRPDAGKKAVIMMPAAAIRDSCVKGLENDGSVVAVSYDHKLIA